MSLTFGLRSARDLFDKLGRDAALLDAQVTGDRFFNFVVTGYSLIDWVKKDNSIPTVARSAVQSLYTDPSIQICGDLATACKHFELTKRRPITQDATLQQGFGAGRFGAGAFGVGEDSIEVRLNDGTTFSALELTGNVLGVWRAFFASHGI
jgi:hypothetical protein